MSCHNEDEWRISNPSSPERIDSLLFLIELVSMEGFLILSEDIEFFE